MLPIIAIIGRPNVGKSTLFNRLIGKQLAITSSVPGTTRDRIYHESELGKYRTILVDTGGMEFEKKTDIEADIQAQAKLAVSDADIIYFVVDATSPLLSNDIDAAQFLRKSGKPIIVIANKSDNYKSDMLAQFYKFGFGEAIPVSSIHNQGFLELDAETAKVLRKMKWKKEPIKKKSEINIAIVGKPNVGKSSIVNALTGEKRLIVSEKPGTTIDSTDTPFNLHGQNFVLIDTAGLRRRGRAQKILIERYGVLRSLKAISRADIACLVIDWNAGIANQDLHVSQYILDAKRGLIIVVNKSDLMTDPEKDRKKFLDFLQYRMSFMPWAPVIFTSALKRKNIFQILDLSKNIDAERKKKIDPYELSIFFKTTISSNPPAKSGKKIIITKGSQTGINPPQFTFICYHPDSVHFSYRRFLENEIRRKFGFFGTAIELIFKRMD